MAAVPYRQPLRHPPALHTGMASRSALPRPPFPRVQLRQKMRERQEKQKPEKARKASERGRAATSAQEAKTNKYKEIAARREEANRKERERERVQVSGAASGGRQW